MNYQKIYNQIIEKRQKEILVKLPKSDPSYQYYEIHHIIPRILGGSNDSLNLIVLTAKEHFICHLLLVKICEEIYGLHSKQYCSMLYALNLMMNENKGNIKICSRQYAILKLKFSNMQHIRMAGQGNPMYGKSIKDHMSQEQYNKWLDKVQNNKNGEKNPFYGKHHSKETIDKIKMANHTYFLKHGHGVSYGVKHSAEARKRNSESHSHPYSHERKLKQNKTIINKCCGHLCDLSEFDFELYITLKPADKVKYRKNYIKTHLTLKNIQ